MRVQRGEGLAGGEVAAEHVRGKAVVHREQEEREPARVGLRSR